MKRTLRLTEARLLDIPLIVNHAEQQGVLPMHTGYFTQDEITKLYEYSCKNKAYKAQMVLMHAIAEKQIGWLMKPRKEAIAELILEDLNRESLQIIYNNRHDLDKLTSICIDSNLNFFNKYPDDGSYFPSEVFIAYLMWTIVMGWEMQELNNLLKTFLKQRNTFWLSDVPTYMTSLSTDPKIAEKLFELSEKIVRKGN